MCFYLFGRRVNSASQKQNYLKKKIIYLKALLEFIWIVFLLVLALNAYIWVDIWIREYLNELE